MQNLQVEINLRINIERVLLNKKGTAVTPERAQDLGVKADILFIRNDGFALGAQARLHFEAYSFWPKSWTHFYDYHTKKLMPISEYRAYVKNLQRH